MLYSFIVEFKIGWQRMSMFRSLAQETDFWHEVIKSCYDFILKSITCLEKKVIYFPR